MFQPCGKRWFGNVCEVGLLQVGVYTRRMLGLASRPTLGQVVWQGGPQTPLHLLTHIPRGWQELLRYKEIFICGYFAFHIQLHYKPFPPYSSQQPPISSVALIPSITQIPFFLCGVFLGYVFYSGKYIFGITLALQCVVVTR